MKTLAADLVVRDTIKPRSVNVFLVILIGLWIAVVIILMSLLGMNLLDNSFTLLTAVGDALIVVVCLPAAIVLFRGSTDRSLKHIIAGLIAFILVAIGSTVIVYGLPAAFRVDLLTYAGQMLWYVGYIAITIPLYLHLKAHRKALDLKIDLFLTSFWALASLFIAYLSWTTWSSVGLNGFGILFNTGLVILGMLVLTILSKLLVISLPNMYRYFFAILFCYLFLCFGADAANLFEYLHLATSAATTYNSTTTVILYIIAQILLTAGLVLYSSRNINQATVEEVRETLRDTECLMAELIDQCPDGLCLCDLSGKPITVNDAFTAIFGAGKNEPPATQNLFAGTLVPGISGLELERVRSGETIVLPIHKTPGSERFLSMKLYPTYTASRKISGYGVVAEDVTQRTMAEREVNASLQEKQMLLKEIHHRVKNNLQIVSSLLSVQASYVADPKAIECLEESQKRIKSMALIHERLYHSEDISRVDFSEYMGNLSKFLLSTYEASHGKVSLALEVENLTLDVDRAIPCALIVNELVSNSLKYAFPADRRGEIRIKMSKTGDRYALVVSDNGVGFPAAIDFRNTASLGLQLVNMLTDQLEGTIALDSSDGTRFTITFKV